MKYLLKQGLFIVGFFFTLTVFSQNDIILKTDGEEMKGKVMKMNENDLQFIYQNETIEYTVKKTDVLKITFSSGRIQFFNKETSNNQKNNNLESHHNKVAVLPFGYIKDKETSNVTMTKKIQQETYTIFKKKTVELQYQDPNTTNALLSKAGVTNNNLEGFTMGEICQILSVEYVIQGLVSIEKTSVSDYSSTSSSYKNNSKPYVDSKGNIVGDVWGGNNKGKSTSYSSGTVVQNYATNITMNVYNDKGDNIFSQNHSSFWQTGDAYEITLGYLAKRTPLYKK